MVGGWIKTKKDRQKYHYFSREQRPSWLIAHIEILLEEATLNNSTSSILYAAFEARNLIEQISYDLIVLSTDKYKWSEIERKAKGKQGIRRSNAEYKALKFRYQTFSEAIAKVARIPINAFDYQKAEELENELGEYVHTYTRSQEDMNFNGEFISNGLKKIEEALQFVKNFFIQVDGNNVFGVLNFSTLTGEYKTEFEKWKSGVSTDTEELY